MGWVGTIQTRDVREIQMFEKVRRPASASSRTGFGRFGSLLYKTKHRAGAPLLSPGPRLLPRGAQGLRWAATHSRLTTRGVRRKVCRAKSLAELPVDKTTHQQARRAIHPNHVQLVRRASSSGVKCADIPIGHATHLHAPHRQPPSRRPVTFDDGVRQVDSLQCNRK